MQLQTRIMTAEEFEALALLPENADRRLEFIEGSVVDVVSNNYSSETAGIILGELRIHLKHTKSGRVTGADGGYCVGHDRYIPDVAYISLARQPHPCHDTYNPNAPDLAVEVLSPSDRPEDVRRKIANYLAAGTTVWLVDPARKEVEVYVPGQPVRVLRLDDVLEGGTVLPGFALPVRDIFPVEA